MWESLESGTFLEPSFSNTLFTILTLKENLVLKLERAVTINFHALVVVVICIALVHLKTFFLLGVIFIFIFFS